MCTASWRWAWTIGTHSQREEKETERRRSRDQSELQCRSLLHRWALWVSKLNSSEDSEQGCALHNSAEWGGSAVHNSHSSLPGTRLGITTCLITALACCSRRAKRLGRLVKWLSNSALARPVWRRLPGPLDAQAAAGCQSARAPWTLTAGTSDRIVQERPTLTRAHMQPCTLRCTCQYASTRVSQLSFDYGFLLAFWLVGGVPCARSVEDNRGPVSLHMHFLKKLKTIDFNFSSSHTELGEIQLRKYCLWCHQVRKCGERMKERKQQ